MKLGNSRNEINSNTIESWFQSMSLANCVFNTPISLLTPFDFILRNVFPHGDKKDYQELRVYTNLTASNPDKNRTRLSY